MTLHAADIQQINAWLVEAGALARAALATVTYNLKQDRTPVSTADYAVETYLAERLQDRFPDHRLVTEETGVMGAASDRLWALDPIDGTKIFLAGLPTWGISLGLLVEGQPAAGFFHMPATGDLYWGWAEGAFCNGQRLARVEAQDYHDPLMFVAVPSNAHQHYRIHYPRLRSFGSTAAHLAWLARGATIGVITRHVSLWDLAGVLPLLAQTGIRIEYLSGRPLDFNALLEGQTTPEPVLAASLQWFDKLRSAISEI
jgi:myo-inositol-1(or 4)-monophosphatase